MAIGKHYQKRGKASRGVTPKLRFRAILFGGILSMLILLLIPFTQYLTGLQKQDKKIRSFDVVQPPPPPPPDIDEPPEEPPQEEPPPEMEAPPPQMDLAQLELALNPGIGDAVAGGAGFGGFDLATDAAQDIELFDVKDLDQRPQPIRQVKMEPPSRFRQERISGMVRVEIMIDENGRTTVLKIVDSSHAELEQPAREALSEWTWSPPKKNGEPVNARYILPIGFRF